MSSDGLPQISNSRTPIWAETRGVMTDVMCLLMFIFAVIGIIVDIPSVASSLEPGERHQIISISQPSVCDNGTQTRVRFHDDSFFEVGFFDPAASVTVSQEVEGNITADSRGSVFPNFYNNIRDFSVPYYCDDYYHAGGYQIRIPRSLPSQSKNVYFTGNCGKVMFTVTRHTTAYSKTHRLLNITFTVIFGVLVVKFLKGLQSPERFLMLGLLVIHTFHLSVSVIETYVHSWKNFELNGGQDRSYVEFNSGITSQIVVYYIQVMVFVLLSRDVFNKIICISLSTLLSGFYIIVIIGSRTFASAESAESSWTSFGTSWFLFVSKRSLGKGHIYLAVISGVVQILYFLGIMKLFSYGRIRYLHVPYLESRGRYLQQRIFIWVGELMGLYFTVETILCLTRVYYPTQLMPLGKEIFFLGITCCLSVLMRSVSHPHTSFSGAIDCNRWRNISWPLSWRRWLHDHRSAFAFYYFETRESEMEFWRKQLELPCEDWSPRSSTFHTFAIINVWMKSVLWLLVFVLSIPILIIPFGGSRFTNWLTSRSQSIVALLHQIPPLNCTFCYGEMSILRCLIIQLLFISFLIIVIVVHICVVPVVVIVSDLLSPLLMKIPSWICVTLANTTLRTLHQGTVAIFWAIPTWKDDSNECLAVPTFCLETSTILAQVCYETYRSCPAYEKANPLACSKGDTVEIYVQPNEKTSILHSGMSSANIVGGRRGQPPPNRPIDVPRCGVELICVLVEHGMQVVIGKMAQCDDCETTTRSHSYVVAFRGTANDSNKKCDLDFLRIEWVEGASVHGGFMKLWRSIEDDVMAAVQSHCVDAERFFITGHSLGAAIATLCSHSMASKYGSSHVALYTFGIPRMGDAVFKREMDSCVPHNMNIRNENDACTFASGTPGNQHAGVRIEIGRCGQIMINPCSVERLLMPWGVGSPITAHKLVRYLSSLSISATNFGVPLRVNIGDEDEVSAWGIGPSAGPIPTGSLVGVKHGINKSSDVDSSSYSTMTFGHLTGYLPGLQMARLRTVEAPYFIDVSC